MPTPYIRPGFPVVASSAGAAAPYTVLTGVFSANAGDELSAIVMGGGLPVVVSRNSANSGPGVLKWLRRFVTRVDFTTTSTNVSGAQQVAIYTAVVPAGGVTERASFTTSLTANDGGASLSPNNLPARLAIIAVNDTNGVGAIAWKGSMKAGSGGSNDITTGLAATQVIKPFGASSLIIGGGWFIDGSTPVAAGGCTEVVAAGTDKMPIWSTTGGLAGADVTVGSSITDSTLWALGLIEYLPTTTPKATHKLFCFGDSGIESTNSARQTAVVVQDTLAPTWELFNYGVWYAHTAQTLARWTADSPAFPEIHAAIVQVGMNDVSDNGNTWPSAAQTDLASLYSGLSALGIPLACYTGIGPLATPGVAPVGYYDFRDWVTANAPSGTHIYSLDLVTDPASGYLALYPSTSSSDGGHISAAGNVITGADISAWIGTLSLITISAHPADQTVNDGETANFSITASGGTSYQWKKNGTNVGTNSSSLALTASFAEQDALITCDVIGASETVTSSAAKMRAAFNLTGTGVRRRQTFASTPFASTGPLGAPAGGGPITGSISETLSATDTVTASAVFASAVAETAAAVDTITASAITAAAVAETGSASDSVSATVTFNAVVAETLAAVDTPSALLVLIAQVNETLAALDTQTASALFNAAVQETLAAADTVTASAVFNASITETLAAVDTTDATITGAGGTTYNDSVSETLSAVDTVSASANFSGAIAETLSAADSIDALLTQLGVIAETLAATETVNGLISATAAISETGAVADTVTSLLVTTASVQEVANAIETITTQTNFNATIVEVMNAFDSTDATGGSTPTTSGHAYWLLLKRRTRR